MDQQCRWFIGDRKCRQTTNLETGSLYLEDPESQRFQNRLLWIHVPEIKKKNTHWRIRRLSWQVFWAEQNVQMCPYFPYFYWVGFQRRVSVQPYRLGTDRICVVKLRMQRGRGPYITSVLCPDNVAVSNVSPVQGTPSYETI